MSNKFVNILETVVKDVEKGLVFIVKYLPAVDTIAGLLFPASVAPLATATSVADLLQNAIVITEQKFAASGAQNGTGAQKLAEVSTLAGQAVTTLLADPATAAALQKAGIVVDSTYINNLISAIVGFLNVQAVVTA